MRTRAKFKVTGATPFRPFTNGPELPIQNVCLEFAAVTTKPFDPDGKSEDNDFARWTPTGKLEMTVTNPALFDTFKIGQSYYLDFTPAE